jgi:anti-anti-sigma regulatory factor
MSDTDLGYGLFHNEICAIELAQTLDAAAGAALRARLLADLEAFDRFELDAAPVVRIGTPAVQVLVAGARHLASCGRSLAILNPSEAVRAAFADLALEQELDRWSAPGHG